MATSIANRLMGILNGDEPQDTTANEWSLKSIIFHTQPDEKFVLALRVLPATVPNEHEGGLHSVGEVRQRARADYHASAEYARLQSLSAVERERKAQLATLEKELSEARVRLQRLLDDSTAGTAELLDHGRRVQVLEAQAKTAREESTPAAIVSATKKAEQAAHAFLGTHAREHFIAVKREINNRMAEIRNDLEAMLPHGLLNEYALLLQAEVAMATSTSAAVAEAIGKE